MLRRSLGQGRIMSTVYVLLLLAVLLVIVFLTWGPLSKTAMHAEPQARRNQKPVPRVTTPSKTVELPPLDYWKSRRETSRH